MIEKDKMRISGETARVIIKNCHYLMRRKFGRAPLWSMVGSITGHGSGYSSAICESANLDPDQLCSVKELKDWKEHDNDQN
jgi:hypothetical protein